ncbi:MAG TPA: hypothetical protein VN805_17485 [Caulobacteraceae bacterium]|nr:hypothetical protein [Caulobacteraceae bacterium]
MMRFGATALAIAVVFGASAALAEDVDFAAFHRICVATGGERNAALAAAEADGFVRPPKFVLDQVSQSAVPLDNADVRAKLIPDGVVWVSVGKMSGAFQNRYTTTDMCVLGVDPMNPASEKAAIAWGGVTPTVTDPQYQMLLFTGGEGAHRAVPDAKVLDDKTVGAVASAADLQLLGAGNTEGVTLMLYGLVKAVAAPASSASPSQSGRSP